MGGTQRAKQAAVLEPWPLDEARKKRTNGPRDLERAADFRRLLNALGRVGMNFIG